MANIQRVVDTNAKFLDDTNQVMHNAGVLFEKRIDFLLELLHGKFEATPKALHQPLRDILNAVSVSREELFQKVFMFYGSKYLKKEFNQFYTPLTIGEFICGLCVPNKRVIDPACGTGDLAMHYTGNVTLWDISKDVTDLATQNYRFQTKPATILTKDSIQMDSEGNGTYEYVIANPPFGTRTLITSPEVLNKYVLGKGKKKQEVGILFVERSMNLLKDNGILFIILPNGYFGNTTNTYVELRKYLLQYRVVGVLKLPQNTFKRSGTGVSTNILIVSKSKPTAPYDIFIEEVSEIGYELNKKHTPYKYRKNKSAYILDSRGNPILQNDLPSAMERLKTFAKRNAIPNIAKPTTPDTNYQTFNTQALDDTRILDISRYLRGYVGLVTDTAGKCSIRDLLEADYKCVFRKDNDREYVYLDIKEINTPLYNGKKLLGHALPSRAKYQVKKHDVLVSRLKGDITFTVILEDRENLVCTNGVCVLRPKDADAMLTLFASLFSSEFKVQHKALTTGSIMESISDDDMKNIVIPSELDRPRYERILASIAVLQTELPTS